MNVNNGNILILEVSQGRPMPARLREFIHEGSFDRMRDACSKARTTESFENIVQQFSSTFGIDGAVQAIEVGHNWSEVIGSTLYAPIGLIFGGWDGFKSPKTRLLRVDLNILRQVRHAFPVADVSLAGGSPPPAPIRAQVHVIQQNRGRQNEEVPVATASVIHNK